MKIANIFYHNLTNEYILSQIPRDYLISVIDSIESAYRTAYSTIHQEFQKPLANRYYPILRPAYIDQEINLITANFDQVTSTYNPNAIKNSLHTEVSSGDFVITFSKVDHKNEMVRKAVFRESLAKDNQTVLFKEIQNEKTETSGKIYALITHVPNAENPEEPISINFAIPKADCSGYIRNISLYDLTGYDTSSGKIPVESDIDSVEPTIITTKKTDSED